MAMVSDLQRQDYVFSHTTSAGVWRWTTRVDLSLGSPQYSIRGIVTPWGLYREDAPIPEEVVSDMAASIQTVKQSFHPTILVGPLVTLSFVVDEGRGYSDSQKVVITNSGVWGSLLSATLVPADSWLHIDPAVLNGLSSNESGNADVSVDSTTLLSALSPYTSTISVTDPTASNNPQDIPVNVTVRPKATITLSTAQLEFTATRPLTGQYAPIPVQSFVISNTGLAGSSLEYQIQKVQGLSDWLAAFSPPVGTIAGGASETITVLVQPPSTMVAGVYEETLSVSGYSTNKEEQILIRLVIT